MTTFQLLLLVIAGGVFYLFFKQLFSGNHPKRGVDFEAKIPQEQVGGISRPDKIFTSPASPEPTRTEQLLAMADEAVAKEDFDEAKKALGSALIIDESNTEVLGRMGYVQIQMQAYQDAKETYEKLLALDDKDDMAHAALANVLHKLSSEEDAKMHHERAITLDATYAPHHFNYANTLYDLGRKEEALAHYTKAYELDNTLQEAKTMIQELGGKHE